ncbi:hypothetical protein [Longirhabdus pacifica]|uniref:hypothetical protein n=1 Tax=Longirhabdus pacifica TaxID=2305227 RepID=UPI001980E00A|nr:hypothetical protein [Longirhabdus pacifica]
MHRVLKPNGIFITQQVGGQNGRRLSNMLIPHFIPKYEEWKLHNTSQQLQKEHFEIIYANEYHPYQKFFTIEALIYYAKVIQWEFPDFTVSNNFQQLLEAEKERLAKGYILNYQHRFIIVSRKRT